MSRYRVHYIEGSGDNLRIRKEQTVEAPSFQDALERFTHWPAAEACEQSPACTPIPAPTFAIWEAWEVFLLRELILGKEGFTAVYCAPFFPIPRIS